MNNNTEALHASDMLSRSVKVAQQAAFMKKIARLKLEYPTEYAIAFDHVKANLSKSWLDNQTMLEEKFNELTGLAKVAA